MAIEPKRVLVPIANGTEPMEAVITIAVLRFAGADVRVASIEQGLNINAWPPLKIVADGSIKEKFPFLFDLVALPGGMHGASRLRDHHKLRLMMQDQQRSCRMYAAIGAAPPVILGTWGFIWDLHATCLPSLEKELSSSHAKLVRSRVHVDGQFVTSKGLGTAMEFSVALVKQLFGKDKADEVSTALLMQSKCCNSFISAEMNGMGWTYSSKLKILVPIADGIDEIEAVVIIDVLRRANAEVTVASLGDSLEIVASQRVKLVADQLLDEAAKQKYDLIVLPGGVVGAQTFAASATLKKLLRDQSDSNRYYGAIGVSPARVLKPYGLLKGKKATGLPEIRHELSDDSEADKRVVVDGQLITSQGRGTSLEFSLAIVEKFCGRKKAIEVAEKMFVV